MRGRYRENNCRKDHLGWCQVGVQLFRRARPSPRKTRPWPALWPGPHRDQSRAPWPPREMGRSESFERDKSTRRALLGSASFRWELVRTRVRHLLYRTGRTRTIDFYFWCVRHGSLSSRSKCGGEPIVALRDIHERRSGQRCSSTCRIDTRRTHRVPSSCRPIRP